MSFLKIFMEPTILIITVFFIGFILIVFRDYSKTEKNLKSVNDFLLSLNKSEISYRFNEMDSFLSSNAYTSTSWEDLKKSLVFPEKIFVLNQKSSSPGSSVSEVYLTTDSSYFFNEESLVHSKINYKFIQIMPTLLTGLGPFFTFLKMAITFTMVDLSYANAENSLNTLINGIQIAALCSVFAVGYSLLFMLFEKILYNNKCKYYYISIQNELIRLFDVCTSEQFLLDLIKESKLQSVRNENLFKTLPHDLSKEITKSLGELTIPYLENIIYSLNKINESLEEKNKIDNNNNSDVIDKLF